MLTMVPPKLAKAVAAPLQVRCIHLHTFVLFVVYCIRPVRYSTVHFGCSPRDFSSFGGQQTHRLVIEGLSWNVISCSQ